MQLPLALVQDFSPEVLQCIERGLSKFGKSVAPVVFWNFEHQTKLRTSEIYRRPDLFSDSLRHIFADGSAGIENRIVQEIVTTFHLSRRNYNGLDDAVNELKKIQQHLDSLLSSLLVSIKDDDASRSLAARRWM
jgi:hypothetical protein